MTQVEAHMGAYVVSDHQSNLMENGTHMYGMVTSSHKTCLHLSELKDKYIMDSTPALESLDTLVLTVLLSQAYDFSIIDAT